MKRNTLIEQRYHEIKRRKLNFMRVVQERVSKMKTYLTTFLPNDLMFKIFLLMPIKTLLRFTCVCKSWKKMIRCAEFVEAYNNEAQSTVILLKNMQPDRLNIFHIETQVNQSESFSIFPCSRSEILSSKVINFLEIENGKSKIVDLNISCKGSIVATCNGLILISSKFENLDRTASKTLDSHERPGRLIIMNPVTRKFIGFPLGTLPSHTGGSESHGLMFSHLKSGFKVVHLFKDELGHIACEVWSMETKHWRAIDGPCSNHIDRFSNEPPIWASGALHWIPRWHHYDPIDYIVSMGADDERFFVTDLPNSASWYSKLVEMGGVLSFVSSLEMNRIEVWVLKGFEGSEWIKQQTINIDGIAGCVEYQYQYQRYSMAVVKVNAKEIIFERQGKLYSYGFEDEEVREIEMEGGRISGSLISHTNNLATWEPLEPME